MHKTHITVLVLIAAVLAGAIYLASTGALSDGRLARAIGHLVSGRPVGWQTLVMPAGPPAGDFSFIAQVGGYEFDSRDTSCSSLPGPLHKAGHVHFALSPGQRDSVWAKLLACDYFDMPAAVPINVTMAGPTGEICRLRVTAAGRSYDVGAMMYGPSSWSSSRGPGIDLLNVAMGIDEVARRKPVVRAFAAPLPIQ